MKPLILFIFPLLLLSSCDKEIAVPDKDLEKVVEISWDWADYEQATEVTLRQMNVQVVPKNSFEIKSESSGIFTLDIEKKNSNVKEGQVIGKMDLESLAEQEERLEIEEAKYKLSQVKEEELENPQRKKAAVEAVDTAKNKLKLMRHIIKNPAMKKMASELTNGEVTEVDDKALKAAEEELAIAEKKLKWALDNEEKIRQGAKRIQEMEMAKKRRQFQEVKDRAVYKAPFEGELRIDLNFIEGQQEYTLTGRETIATISDFEEIHAQVVAEGANWLGHEPDQLLLKLNDKKKTVFFYKEDRMVNDPRTRRNKRTYIFSVPLGGNESLKRLAGARMKSDLILRLPSKCYIVPKYELSLYALGKSESLKWEEMVKQLWPSAVVHAEGQKFLAIEFDPASEQLETQPSQ